MKREGCSAAEHKVSQLKHHGSRAAEGQAAVRIDRRGIASRRRERKGRIGGVVRIHYSLVKKRIRRRILDASPGDHTTVVERQSPACLAIDRPDSLSAAIDCSRARSSESDVAFDQRAIADEICVRRAGTEANKVAQLCRSGPARPRFTPEESSVAAVAGSEVSSTPQTARKAATPKRWQRE